MDYFPLGISTAQKTELEFLPLAIQDLGRILVFFGMCKHMAVHSPPESHLAKGMHFAVTRT